MKKKLSPTIALIALIFFSINALSIAQNHVMEASTHDIMNGADKLTFNGNSSRTLTSFDNRYEGAQGSPFIFSDWSDGRLVLKDSVVIKNKLLYKFDLIQNEIWIKVDEKTERILFSKDLLSLELLRPDGKNIFFKKAKLPKVTTQNYFSQVVFEGKNVTLIKDVQKVFRRADLQDRGIVTTGKAYDWFEEVTEFYLKKGNGAYLPTKLKRKDFAEILKLNKTQAESLENFCKENEISRKMNDVETVKMLAFIDTLL